MRKTNTHLLLSAIVLNFLIMRLVAVAYYAHSRLSSKDTDPRQKHNRITDFTQKC